MKNHGIRISALLLALCLLLSSCVFCLTACTGNGGEESTSALSEDQTTSAGTDPSDDPASPTELALIQNGEANFRIVRHYDLNSSAQDIVSAKDIYKTIYDACGVDVPFGNDFLAEGKTFNQNTLEILIGSTDYPESRQAISALPYGEYSVSVAGNKIVVVGFSEGALRVAAAKLKNKIKESITTNPETGKAELTLTADAITESGLVNGLIALIPRYEGGTGCDFYDTGNQSDELIVRGTNLTEYDAYLAKLEKEGFAIRYTKEVTGNKFIVAVGEKYTLNVGFFAYETSTRILIEPTSTATVPAPASENKFNVVTTSQISMIGLEYLDSSNSYVGNGLCILIRLADGRFIVVDGGFNRQNDADLIVNEIKKQAQGYANAQTGYTIAAWIVTHAHGDHMGMIANKSSTLKNNKIKVENFIVNFLSDVERNKAISSNQYGGNWSSSEGSGDVNVLSAANLLGANVIYAHPGHDYYFADLRMEVLYTIDSYGPAIANALNTTSLIIKMTFTDPKTGKQTVYMSTGDATGAGFGICANMYGSYLKSDIVQVAHHGATTWGNPERTIAAYVLMAPSTLLWPRGLDSIDSSMKNDYNKALFDKRNPNWRETYVAGREGTVITLPMPYTVGSASAAPYSKK